MNRTLLSISDLLQAASVLPTAQARVEALQNSDMPAVRTVLKYMLDPNIKFLLPETDPPYNPSQFDEPSRLYNEARRLYLFVEGGHETLTQRRREELFIDLLESVAPNDATLLISMKNKVNPYPGLTMAVVNKAYPGLFSGK
jgi:hypothetical protein